MKGITPMKQRLYFIFASSVMLVLLATGCSRDNEAYQPSEEEVMANAEDVLGVKISSDLDWNMTASARASITVNGNFGETYTVKIYSNDPLVDGKGYVLKRGQVESGGTFEVKFDYPSASSRLMVGVSDSKGFTSYKSVAIVDGLLETTFGGDETAGARTTRSRETPSVSTIEAPYDEVWVAEYLRTATEPTDNNVNHNYDNSRYENNWDVLNAIAWDESDEDMLRRWFTNNGTNNGMSWEETVAWALENRPNWVKKIDDLDYVTKFKITGTWNGNIGVAASEGYLSDHVTRSNAERTVVVTGTWNLTINQRLGEFGRIIIANGGTLNIAEWVKLELVNHARLVVLQGGTITGKGEIEVTNGNTVGEENYNAGTIDVKKFNNNFGKFYNYGIVKADVYAAGAQESNFYNHGVVHILGTYENNNSVSPNARIYNACQWICVNDMRAYIVENTMGSYFKVGGQLMMSIGNDGTNDPSYVALGKGALVRLGSLYNNASDWIGPTNGTAVLEIGQVNYLNWDFQNTPKHGYFINNIAITLSNKQNTCDGNNVWIAEYGENMTAYQKMNVLLINGTGGDKNYMGNGGTVFVEENGANVFVPVDGDFVEGVKGCTPGYNGKGRNIYDEPAVWTYAFEDTPLGDYDMNDVVIKVSENADDSGQLEVYLCCVGASFDLYLYFGETALFYGKEIHDAFGQARGVLINTGGGGPEVDITKMQPAYVDKPDGFSFADADFWVKSPLVPEGIHVAKKGEAPLGVAIPGDWLWPLAGVNIEEAYPNFIEFAKDVEKADENARKWYVTTDTNPVRDKVFVLANSSWQ
ncbi:MAG: DUF4842 domain-containing protein [Prevotella sp.]|nr:DUF4842 domain-containing protein [Prevotella sp.]